MAEVSVIVLALFRDKRGREIMLHAMQDGSIGLLYKPRRSKCWHRVEVISKDKQTSTILAKVKTLGKRRWQIKPAFCNVERMRRPFDLIYPDILKLVGDGLFLVSVTVCDGE